MLENALVRRNLSLKLRVTIKGLVALGVVALAVLLPQFVHLVAGQAGGVQWLPMYFPILIGGCVLGWAWGLGVGLSAPLVSFAITSAFGAPMPAPARLPFMMAELAVFASVTGLFSNQIAKNGWMAFPAVLLAAVAGRAFFLLLVVIFQAVAPFSVAVVWGQIQTGLLAVVLQAVIVPLLVMAIRALIARKEK